MDTTCPQNQKEEILIPLLDRGFVKLVDFMGSDLRAVNAARVSFGGVSKGEAKDKALIKYLMEHEHLILNVRFLVQGNGCGTV